MEYEMIERLKYMDNLFYKVIFEKMSTEEKYRAEAHWRRAMLDMFKFIKTNRVEENNTIWKRFVYHLKKSLGIHTNDLDVELMNFNAEELEIEMLLDKYDV